MTLALATICTAIANLPVPGVDIRDLDNIPEAADPRIPTLFPEPVNFVSNFSVVRESFGDGSHAKMTASYLLTYTLCYAPIGLERNPFIDYAGMVNKAFEILDTLISETPYMGSVDTQVDTALNFGPIADPSGNRFHGCQFQIRVTEFIN